MDKETAELLLPIVNDLDYFSGLQKYAEYRIKQLHKSLYALTDLNEILRVQGQIKELVKFETLKDEVQRVQEAVKNGSYVVKK